MVRPLLAVGHIYFAQQDRKNAREWYERALKTDPNSIEVRVALGHFLFAAGMPEAGRAQFQRAVELSPDQERIRLALAEHYVALGRPREAEGELAALIAGTNSYKARKAVAELKLTAGQVAEVKPLVAAILEADQHDPIGLYLKGRIALAEDNLLEAASLFEEAIRRAPSTRGR